MEFIKLFVESGLFIDEIRHGAVSAIFSIFLWSRNKSLKLALIPIFVTYMIDFDHLFDYFLYYGFNFNPVDYIRMDYFKNTARAVVPLHAWEWLFVISALAWQKRTWKSWQAAIALGLLSHLIWDSYTVGNPSFYVIIYRAIKSFIILG